jgi:7-carboxy-7-deazaguanine synthase
MPQPPILKVNEIFASVQGEGLRQGEPTIFVRLTGCNLRCDFCDTKYAWEGGDDISVQQVIEQVKQQHKEFPADWVCITGGEPLLQDIRELAQKIKREDLKIQIETNGTRFQKLPVDWYTVSPKPDKYFVHPELIKIAREVKLVVTEELGFDVVRKIRQEFPLKIPLLLQPESNEGKSRQKGLKFLKNAAEDGLKNLKLSLQLHKIYGWQ